MLPAARRTLACAAAFVPLVLAPAAIADPTPTAAITELNQWREALGEAPVSTADVSAWDAACQHHNNYEQQNRQLTHPETMGKPGWTADGAVAGPDSVLAEELSSPSPTPATAMLPGPVWDSAVFHRQALLQPRLANVGFNSTTFQGGGGFTSWQCMWVQNNPSDNPLQTPPLAIDDSRTTPSLTLYPSPANGSYEVPTTFPAGTESPDPATEDGVPAGATLGWLLSVEINGPWQDSGGGGIVFAHGVTATLEPDGTSHQVPVVVSECGDQGCAFSGGTKLGRYLGGGFGIFPTQRLAGGTTYRATATGTVTDNTDPSHPINHQFSIHWCFSTGATYTTSSDCSASSTGAGAEPGHYVASVTPGAPKLTASSLALGSKPKLGLSIVAGQNAPPLKSARISPPKGISFSRKPANLRKGVVVTVGGRRVAFKSSGGVSTTIALTSPGTSVEVKIGAPALVISKSLARAVQRHHLGRLKFTVKVTDAAGKSTTLRVEFVFH
jgi:hypothetical protein